MGLLGSRVPAPVREKESQRTMLRLEIDTLERKQRSEKNPRKFESRRAEINAAKRELRALG